MAAKMVPSRRGRRKDHRRRAAERFCYRDRSMIETSQGFRPAFRELRRALLRRRVSIIDPRLRLELLGLAIVVAAFVFWQARVPLDALSRQRGPLPAAGVVAAFWLVLAASAAALSGSGHALQLQRGPAGPPWLTLPIPLPWVARQLRWDAGPHIVWLIAPAAGMLAAVLGLIPIWMVVALAAALPGSLLAGGRLGCALAYHWSRLRAEPRPGVPTLARLLAAAEHPVGRPRPRPGRWRTDPAWVALWRKDARLGLRAGIRQRFVLALALGALSALSWTLPASPAVARLFAFVLALVGSAILGEWLIVLAGQDPFPIQRGLPLRVRSLWASRGVWVVGWSAALVLAHALLARPLETRALHLFLIWTGGASLVIGALAVNYGITLFPRSDVGMRVYHLALALAMAASLMIPMAGWVVLLAAVIHSLRRLPRWRRLEDSP
jgi:hypothetical protein